MSNLIDNGDRVKEIERRLKKLLQEYLAAGASRVGALIAIEYMIDELDNE